MPSYRTLVVLQPTPFCNIDCTYCYLPDRTNRSRMSLEVVRRAADEVFGSHLVEPPIAFLWHLGEPLAIPRVAYEEFFAAIELANRPHGREYSHAFQTNGTLLDREWVELIARHRITLGISVDGPAFVHDRHRLTRSHRGTHDRVMAGIHLIQEARVPFSVIAVLTDFTLDHADEFFRFFADHGLDDVGLNLDEIEGAHRSTSFGAERAIARYQRFLARLLELSELHAGAVKFREIWTNLRTLAVGGEEPLNMTNSPFRILNFDASGNFHTFCPELMAARDADHGDFRMGNILEDSLDDLPHNEVFVRVNEAVRKGVDECRRTCSYWRFCGGGSPSNKFFEHGKFDVSETTTCKIHKKATVDVLVAHLERTLLAAAGEGRHDD